MGDWSPRGATEWLRNPDWVLDEPLPENPASMPLRNGLPETVPYTYRGTGQPEPELAGVTVIRRRKPARKPGPPAIDPGGPPLSAPLEWLRWLKYEEETP